MVLREKKINNKSDEVQLHCSFSIVDVRALLKIYVSFPSNEFWETCPITEKEMRYWFEYNEHAFLSWPKKWREQLSGWAFAVAVRNKLLVQSSTDENKYYFADCLFTKRGRPKKKQ